MSGTELTKSIIKLLQDREIAPTQSNISLISNAYYERFDTFKISQLNECIDEIFGPHGQIRRNGSKSVTFFNINPTGLFIPYDKPEDKKIFLRKTIETSVLHSLFNPRQVRNIVLALKPLFIQVGFIVIKENDIGTEMYVVESGVYDVIKHNRVIETVTRGMIFGEIALLHNVKRTATIKCKEEGVVWILNMEDFIAIKSTHEMNMFRKFKDTLRDDPLFKSEFYKTCKEKKVFLTSGMIIDPNFYLIVVNDGSITIDGVKKYMNPGDVCDRGIVLDEIEGYQVPKHQV